MSRFLWFSVYKYKAATFIIFIVIVIVITRIEISIEIEMFFSFLYLTLETKIMDVFMTLATYTYWKNRKAFNNKSLNSTHDYISYTSKPYEMFYAVTCYRSKVHTYTTYLYYTFGVVQQDLNAFVVA